MLKRLETRWKSGNIGDAYAIVKLDRQITQLEKKIRALA
jgi:hypothetical protein